MKQLTFLLPALMAANICLAQNENLKSKYAVKLSNLTTWNKAESSVTNLLYTATTVDKQVQLFHPTVAFRIKNERDNFHEMELTQFEWDKDDNSTVYTYPNGMVLPASGSKTTITGIALRYEYVVNFFKQKNGRWMPAIGFGAMPYFQRSHTEPFLSNEYPETQTKFGMKTFIVPRINYAVSRKFFVDFNIPLCVSDIYYNKGNANNPNLSIAEQQSSTINFDAGKNILSFRLGLGMNI